MIQLSNITKTYRLGGQEFHVLHNISLTIAKGEFVAIMGQSGSGKSTLMNMIGLLDTPSLGNYFLDGKAVESLSEDEHAVIRSRLIGFVFQSYNLLPRLNAIRQVGTPLMYQGVGRPEREKRAAEALITVGLSDRMQNEPSEMSGGEQQRVAIARVIAARPEIILADEPTGALDSRTGQEIMDVLAKLNQEGKTIIIVTHESEVASRAKRIINLKDGIIV
ncbi:MAG: ABC transporter ATP-binding protein [Patescibacteria group bacterium]